MFHPEDDELGDDELDCDVHVERELADDQDDPVVSELSLLSLLLLWDELLLDFELWLDTLEDDVLELAEESDELDMELADEDEEDDPDDRDELDRLDFDELDRLESVEDDELWEDCEEDSIGMNSVGATLHTLPSLTARLRGSADVETDTMGLTVSTGATMIVPVENWPTTWSPNELYRWTVADRTNGESDG